MRFYQGEQISRGTMALRISLLSRLYMNVALWYCSNSTYILLYIYQQFLVFSLIECLANEIMFPSLHAVQLFMYHDIRISLWSITKLVGARHCSI